MNIDMTVDYDKLLEEAKKRHKKVRDLDDEANMLFSDGAPAKKYWPVQKKFLAEHEKFLDWKKNVDKLGVKLLTNFHDGTPVGIAAVISGHDNYLGEALSKTGRRLHAVGARGKEAGR